MLGAFVLLHGCSGDSPTTNSPPSASGWVKESGTLSSDLLNDAWASPSGSIFMGSNRGEVLRFDGRSWTATGSLPNSVYSLFGFSDYDLFAAIGYVFHYNGKAWTQEQVAPGGGSVSAIWGSDPSTMFGVGFSGGVARRVNARWEWGESPTTRALYAIWGSSSHEIFAVGELGRIIEYDGASWHNVESDAEWTLHDIWGRSRSDVYAVGDRATITHFDGKSWTRLPDIPLESFMGVWGNSDAAYFVTAQGNVYERHGGELKQVFHSNGLFLRTIAGSTRAGLVAGGANGVTVIRGRDGWTSTEQDENTQFESASMGGDGTLFVTGYGPMAGFVRSRRTNESWTDRAEPLEWVERIWAADHDHAFGLRSGNTLHRLIGSSWDELPAPGFEYAYELFGFDQTHVAIAGDSLVGWFDGSNWTTESVGDSVRVSDMWGTAPDHLWATSYDGRVYAWDGNLWSLQAQFESAMAITGTSSHDVWVAESWNQLQHFDGDGWTETLIDYEPGYYTRLQLLSVAYDDVFMIGHGSDVEHFDGRGWRQELTPPCAFLSALAGSAAGGVAVVGDNGTLLRLER